MKLALVGVGDGLPAAEISTSALRQSRRSATPEGFRKVNEFGQAMEVSDDGNHTLVSDEDEGIKELVAGKPDPEEPAPEATTEPDTKVAMPNLPSGQAFPPTSMVVHDSPGEPKPIGKVVYQANHMQMKIGVVGVKFESPVLAIMTPIESDNSFEPPAQTEDVQVKFPAELRKHLPEGIPLNEWVDVYVTGIYFDIEEFGIRLSMFYANPVEK